MLTDQERGDGNSAFGSAVAGVTQADEPDSVPAYGYAIVFTPS